MFTRVQYIPHNVGRDGAEAVQLGRDKSTPLRHVVRLVGLILQFDVERTECTFLIWLQIVEAPFVRIVTLAAFRHPVGAVVGLYQRYSMSLPTSSSTGGTGATGAAVPPQTKDQPIVSSKDPWAEAFDTLDIEIKSQFKKDDTNLLGILRQVSECRLSYVI